MNKQHPFILLSFLGLLFCRATWACPDSLKTYHTEFTQGYDLCSIHDRYQAALQKLREQNIQTPERVGNILAPRFINMLDWMPKRNQDPQTALRIYEPAPMTWLNWEVGAKILDTAARENFRTQRIPTLKLSWLKELHGSTLNGLVDSAGKFRTGGEIGMALTRKDSLTKSQLAGVKNNEYRGILNPETKIVGFMPTQCLEDRSEKFQEEWTARNRKNFVFYISDWPLIDTNLYFVGKEDGLERQCGYFTYAPIEEVYPQVEKWLAFINAVTLTWGTDHPEGDPILVAARAQRWMISIHPYERGNGRMSRFVMDWLLQSIGLPAPLLKNMDEDLYSTEKQWAQEVGNGLLRAISAAETCAQNLAAPGCAVIAFSAEGVKP